MISDSRRPPFSVIVATLNEAAEISETLARASAALGPDAELIVVDGDSRDGTAEVASPAARVIVTAAGRGHQFRTGADAAAGAVLVFLHADTWLEPGVGAAIEAALASGAVAGCLRFAVRGDRPSLRYRVLSSAINWRTRVFRTATGDQALFVTREGYRACGGMPAAPLFEDVRFVRRLRGAGPFVQADSRALTSTRRWDEGGFLATVGRHWLLRALERLGADPAGLAHRYDRDVTRPANRLLKNPGGSRAGGSRGSGKERRTELASPEHEVRRPGVARATARRRDDGSTARPPCADHRE